MTISGCFTALRNGLKRFFEELAESGFALRHIRIVLNIVIPHDAVQDAEIMANKNGIDKKLNDGLVTI